MPLIFSNPYSVPLAVASPFLVHFDGVNGGTSIQSETGETAQLFGDAALSTTQKKFGTASLKNSTGGAQFPNRAGLNPTGAFTAECWFNATTIPNWTGLLSSWYLGYNEQSSWVLSFDNTQHLTFAFGLGSAQTAALTSPVITTGIWHHIAISWDGTVVRMFLDGTLVTSVGFSGKPNSTIAPITIGALDYSKIAPNSPLAYGFNGYIDEVRISNGIAQYTTNFTPQAIPF